jgi:hypothetical protein
MRAVGIGDSPRETECVVEVAVRIACSEPSAKHDLELLAKLCLLLDNRRRVEATSDELSDSGVKTHLPRRSVEVWRRPGSSRPDRRGHLADIGLPPDHLASRGSAG